MPRQIVWYPDGSPVAQLAAALPAPFEGHPLSEASTLRRRTGDPEILLLDEPFGDLDPITLRDVANSLKNINRTFNTTIIFVSHHVDFIKEVAQRAILIDKGHIIGDGDPKKICDEFINASNARYLDVCLEDYTR